MSITYTEANRIAEQCKYKRGAICEVRDKYRDCDRPLCCGCCPTVDSCTSVCTMILGEDENNG